MEKNISHKFGIMTFNRISNRLAMLGKWAEFVCPPLPDVLPVAAFHDFAQYVLIKDLAQYAYPTLRKPKFILIWCLHI